MVPLHPPVAIATCAASCTSLVRSCSRLMASSGSILAEEELLNGGGTDAVLLAPPDLANTRVARCLPLLPARRAQPLLGLAAALREGSLSSMLPCLGAQESW